MKAYPDLDSTATEQIALTQFISSITDSQISFAVKQKAPKTLDEAVITTLQLESYMVISRGKHKAEELFSLQSRFPVPFRQPTVCFSTS